MSERESRLVSLGFSPTGAPAPAANYVPIVCHASLAYLSGALPTEPGEGLIYKGPVQDTTGVERGRKAAELAAVNLLRTFLGTFGSLERIARVIRLGVHVHSGGGFSDAHLVANGASDLLVAVLGEPGRHARTAICAANLPLEATVEVDAIFAVLEDA